MFSLATLVMTAAYMATLFAIAWWYERPHAKARGSGLLGPSLYSLSLAIYCTSWTYYGAVGTAARSGWEYLPVYIGPAIGLTLLFPLWRRIASAARRANAGSIADFLSSRYGKSPLLGASVTIVAILGALPYIALQLRSLTMAGEMINLDIGIAGSGSWAVLILAAVLAGFAILFGARRPDLTEHNRGLIQAIGVESLVKLGALLAATGFALVLLAQTTPSPTALREGLGDLADWPRGDARFMAIILVSALAIFCLPRQFHVGFVEGGTPDEIRRAQWLFPLYLLLTSVAVLPLLVAGRLYFPQADPDLLVLTLPFENHQPLLTAIIFVGGFSAATAMVIIEAVALSAMVSNNLALPLMGAFRNSSATPLNELAGRILRIRRCAIIGILFLSWLYYQAMDRSSGLADMGLVSFTALAQLAPALFGAVLWRTGHAKGAMAGLWVGMTVWFLLLALPQLAPDHPFQLSRLLGLEDPLAAGVFISLGLNLVTYVVVSRLVAPGLIDRVQARAFVDHLGSEWLEARGHLSGASVEDLRVLVARFIGEDRADSAFEAWAEEAGVRLRAGDPADAGLARAAERMLAGALGAVAARRVIGAALSGGGRAPEDVVRMLDEASQAVQFNRQLLLTTLDNIDQGVAVVDEELRLVAWNRPYVEMFGLPHDFLHVGMPIASVYRYNVENGEIDAQSERVESWIARRLEALSRRQHHFHERQGPDGRVLRVVGEPLPGGAYVTSYTDITDLRRAARLLEEANEQLEARVTERTTQLKAAVEMAERATAAKTRFLAAASHDLLQPLHAARLFIAALKEDPCVAQSESRSLANNADRSIESAHRLLTALLNLSKLEAGGVDPAVAPLALGQLFGDIAREFTPIARAKGLELRVHDTRLWISTDRDLLRSMLQNLVANAIRYTDKGAVVVGARRRGDRVEVVVVDTGRGIPEEARARIFGEFVRLPGAPVDEPAAGLGLAIVQRLSDLLGHPLSVQSQIGHGSQFRISTPRTRGVMAPVDTVATSRTPLFGKRVLCVDNEEPITAALEVLLKRWGAVPTIANSGEDALALDGPFDAALVDLHLGDGRMDGLELIRQLKARNVRRIALITAASENQLGTPVASLGAVLLPKPVKPAALKAFLNG